MNKIQKISLVIAVLLVGGAYYFNRNKTDINSTPLPNQVIKAVYDSIPTEAGKVNFMKQSANLTMPVDAELADLDSQIISCAPNVDGLFTSVPTTGGSCAAGSSVLKSTAGMYLGGQCCSAMKDTKEYHENLEKLQAYKNMPDIPLDPMHTPVAMAKKWIDYDNTTKLTPTQQAIYDQAYAISKEKPCCCKCWHYYVNEGIAKKMIIDGTFNAQQVAAYWDASDICGA